MFSGHLLKLVLWSLDFPVMHVRGWIYFPDKRQTNFGHIFLWGADFCVLAFSLFVFLPSFFFFFKYVFLIFQGLAPDELRTNCERTLALRFFPGA